MARVKSGMCGDWLLQAYDIHGEGIDISGMSVGEILNGGDNSVEFDTGDAGDGLDGPWTTPILNMVKKVRTGIQHDWDTETHRSRTIAYFTLYERGRHSRHEGALREAFVTPTGRRYQVEKKDFFPQNVFITDVSKNGSTSMIRWNGPTVTAYGCAVR